MARRLLSRVGGFVHDIDVIASLSDEPNNIRLLSDRSLYILQNLSQEDITFLSRYGEILDGDFYLPVVAGSAEEATVEDAIDIMRRDLNSMTVETLLECICQNLGDLVKKTGDTSQQVEGSFSDGIVSVGEGEQFTTQSEYFDAKCNVSNGIFDTIRELAQWLEDNDVDVLAGVFGGVTSGVLVGLGLAGPVGWTIALVGSVVVAVAGFLIAYALDFEDIGDALDDTHDECVLALFNAGDAKEAEDNFIAALEAGSPTITALESDLVRIFLTSEMVNQLFAPRDDVAAYQSASPIDCGSAILALWTFPSDAEGFTFSDDSDPGSSTSGAYNAPLQALGCTLFSLALVWSRATWTKTGLSIAVTPAASAQFDYTAPSDAPITQTKYMRVTYSDATYEEKSYFDATAGTLVMTLTQTKTIASVMVQFARLRGSGSSTHTTECLEVRIVGA